MAQNTILRIQFVFATLCIALLTACCSTYNKNGGKHSSSPHIGVCWRADTTSTSFVATLMAIREAGGTPVILKPVKAAGLPYVGDDLSPECLDEQGVLKQPYADIVKQNTYKGADIESYLGGIKVIVFPGGEDICPTLFATPEPWHGIEEEKNFDAKRDVSDYLLMSWCLDHDIPTLCICRGMQVLATVSGATMIQDLKTWFESQGMEYHNDHRDKTPDGKAFASHDVSVTDQSSLFYKIAGTTQIEDVPSWHHQAVGSVEGTPLKVTGITKTNGTDVIEAVERTDKTFFIGIQFHPEVAVKKILEQSPDTSKFMPYEEAMKYFRAIVEKGKKNEGVSE